MLRDSAGWRDTASLPPNLVDERRYHQSQNKFPKEAITHRYSEGRASARPVRWDVRAFYADSYVGAARPISTAYRRR